MGRNPYRILGRNPTVFPGRDLLSSGAESYLFWDGILPSYGAESYRILGRNPTVFWGGILPSPLGRILPYFWCNRTLFWSGILPSSGAESYPILGQNPTVFWGGILPYSEEESYRLLGGIHHCSWGQNPTVI
ncbi:hypothetical protein Hamer_G010045 [Homarus americanus]|uniref:Uncharacterized protein n=1 Tax=Homarus americanus TaxID=6706 RepID=A0A8J5JMI5_HOMAM|nr:hypothetical protein Hamer_G010045 [Homarus americanus]